MTRGHRSQERGLQELVSRLGTATTAELLAVLKSRELPEDVLVICALAILCSRDVYGQAPSADHWQIPLDLLAESKHPVVQDAIRRLASNAQNGRIRLEAVRRLGRVTTGADSRHILYAVATNGKPPPAGFQGERITLADMKEAALQAIGEIPNPTAGDRDVVFEVLSAEVSAKNDSEEFHAGAGAWGKIATGADMVRTLDLAEKCSSTAMSLRLLCACSNLGRKVHLRVKDRLCPLLVRSLDQYQSQGDLREQCLNLARSASCDMLIQGLSQAYSGDCLTDGRGAIILAALEAYDVVDDSLIEAYLSFARSGRNSHQSGPCADGLVRCAKAGKAGNILHSLAVQSHSGYRTLLVENVALTLAGDMHALVEHVIDALDGIKEASRRAQLTPMCVVALLRNSVDAIPDVPVIEEHHLQQRNQMHYRNNGAVIEQLANAIKTVDREDSALPWLAQRVISRDPAPGALALADCLLEVDDELSHAFAEEVLAAAGSFGDLCDLPEGAALAECENSILGKCEKWLRDRMPQYLVNDGRLNQYVLDLMRRRHPAFASHARTALGMVTANEDAACILQAIAEKGDRESTKVLGWAIALPAGHVQNVRKVRCEALRLTKETILNPGVLTSPELHDELLSHVHGRFEDTSEVRLLAYGVAEAAAHTSSILPLRERQKTDTAPEHAKRIVSALAAIRERLAAGRPSLENAKELTVWLANVGDLGDDALASQVEEILTIPHSDKTVLKAAIVCAEKLGSRKMLPIIERFVSDVVPTGEVLQAARHARAVLEGRKDLQLLEVLSKILPDESEAFCIDYHAAFGARVLRLTKNLDDALRQYDSGHWDDFVTKIDGVCDLVVRHVYEKHAKLLGLEPEPARRMAHQDYGNRLAMSEFKRSFGVVQPLLATIHDLRRDEATTAHAEDADGTEKPGVGKVEADLTLGNFKSAFVKLASELQSDGEAC